MEEHQREAAKRVATQQQAPQGGMAESYETSSPRMHNFVDCVRSHKNPIAPVEVGIFIK